MKRRHPRRHGILLGSLLGGLIGAIVALVITLVGPGETLWWTPAGFVFGIFGGLVIGFMIAEEVKGGEEDSSPPPRPRLNSMPRASRGPSSHPVPIGSP